MILNVKGLCVKTNQMDLKFNRLDRRIIFKQETSLTCINAFNPISLKCILNLLSLDSPGTMSLKVLDSFSKSVSIILTQGPPKEKARLI